MAELAYHISDQGRAKDVVRIPESHSLYMCPNACGRRQGIRALRNGLADQVSFLRFTEADIVSGDYERHAEEAVSVLLDTLDRKPRVIMLFVNCIDDFLGTDEENLLARLRAAFPATRFLLSRINPIASDGRRVPARSVHARLYELIEPSIIQDDCINIVGNFAPVPPDGELAHAVSALGGWEIRQISTCSTFDEYLLMGQSRLTISVSSMGDAPAEEMGKRLGIPAMSWHATYDIDEIAQNYGTLTLLLGGEPLDFSALYDAAKHEITTTRREVASIPIAVDTAATLRPFSLAVSLLEYGFNVTTVFALHHKREDSRARKRLEEDFSHVTVIERESFEAIKGFDGSRACLAIGFDAAFSLRADHVVDLYHDEGHFGFQGVIDLMVAMREAVRVFSELPYAARGRGHIDG